MADREVDRYDEATYDSHGTKTLPLENGKTRVWTASGESHRDYALGLSAASAESMDAHAQKFIDGLMESAGGLPPDEPARTLARASLRLASDVVEMVRRFDLLREDYTTTCLALNAYMTERDRLADELAALVNE